MKTLEALYEIVIPCLTPLILIAGFVLTPVITIRILDSRQAKEEESARLKEEIDHKAKLREQATRLKAEREEAARRARFAVNEFFWGEEPRRDLQEDIRKLKEVRSEKRSVESKQAAIEREQAVMEQEDAEILPLLSEDRRERYIHNQKGINRNNKHLNELYQKQLNNLKKLEDLLLRRIGDTANHLGLTLDETLNDEEKVNEAFEKKMKEGLAQ